MFIYKILQKKSIQEQGYTMTSTLNTKRFTAIQVHKPHIITIAYKLVRHRQVQAGEYKLRFVQIPNVI